MSGGSICSGLSNFRVEDRPCPWCSLPDDTDVPLHLVADLFGGYLGVSAICGRCGFAWSSDDDRPLRDLKDESRQFNIGCVKLAAIAAAGGATL